MICVKIILIVYRCIMKKYDYNCNIWGNQVIPWLNKVYQVIRHIFELHQCKLYLLSCISTNICCCEIMLMHNNVQTWRAFIYKQLHFSFKNSNILSFKTTGLLNF